ncbi:hypothetical protein TNCV_2151951 [Trichonephila clavipes]|nr:hypothetical protein TNCV_2151951 [Trichonephila clavipes]
MLVILRYCNTSTGSIEENFIRFLAVTETTGEYLTNAILGELEKTAQIFRTVVDKDTTMAQICYVTGMDFAYRGSDEDDIWTRTPMKRRVLCLQWPKDTNSQFAGHKFVTMTTQLPRPLTKVNV